MIQGFTIIKRVLASRIIELYLSEGRLDFTPYSLFRNTSGTQMENSKQKSEYDHLNIPSSGIFPERKFFPKVVKIAYENVCSQN